MTRRKTQSKKKPSWAEIGTMRQAEGKKPYLVINPGVKILVGRYNKDSEEYANFEEVDLGDFRTVQCVDPLPALDALLDGDYISEDEHESRLTFLEEKNVRYKLSIPPVED